MFALNTKDGLLYAGPINLRYAGCTREPFMHVVIIFVTWQSITVSG